MADYCVHSNEPSGFIKGGEFLDQPCHRFSWRSPLHGVS